MNAFSCNYSASTSMSANGFYAGFELAGDVKASEGTNTYYGDHSSTIEQDWNGNLSSRGNYVGDC